MGPFRLIILGLLVYVFYRLLVGGKKTASKAYEQTFSGDNLPVMDVLVEDPVCHTHIPKSQAVQLQHNHKMYHFCSKECCKTFLSHQKG